MNKLKVLDYWLSCVREQDIQKTSLDNNINSYQQLPLDDENVLLSNQRDSVKISISSSLKEILKKERNRQLYRNNKDSRPVFFFPLVVINGQSMPLFYVDLSDLEDRILSKSNDVSFEINPWSIDTKIGVVSDTFVKLGYDEDYIEIGDSVIGFVEKITGQFTLNFQLALKELLDYIKAESHKSTNSYTKISQIKNIGILKYSDFSEATLVFKKDLLYIKENSSLYNNLLIDSYISKKSEGVNFIKEPFVGGFFDFPVSRGQSIAISEVVEGERDIVSVQGGPGTGKTTLILSVIASQLTKRAIKIANGEEDNMGFMLVTSFTNKAVENVGNIIEDEYGEKFKNWLYIQLGNREKRDFAKERISLFIKDISSESFDRVLYEKLKVFLSDAESKLKNSFVSVEKKDFEFNPIERKVLRSLGYSGDYSCHSVCDFVIKIMRIEDNTVSSAISSINYSIKNDASNLEKLNIGKVILERQISFYEDIDSQYPDVDVAIKHGSKSVAADSYKSHRSDSAVKNNKGLAVLLWEMFKRSFFVLDGDIKENVSNGKTSEYLVSRMIKEKGYEPFSKITKKYDSLREKIGRLEHKLARKRVIKVILENASTSFTEHSSLEKGRLSSTLDHKSIFEASLHFIYQHILKNKTDTIESLLAWQSIISGKDTDSHRYHNDFSRFISDVSLPFPVLGCTLSSLGSIFDKSESTFINDKPFEISICDEAGMVPIFCMPSILMRSKRALVIGDQKQLPPIISIDKHRLDEFKARHKLDDKEDIYNPMLSSAFQRSAFAKKSNFSDIGESVILDEHRRCQKEISDCFMDIGGYSNITNHTPLLDEDELRSYKSIFEDAITFVDIEGASSGRRNTNIAEIKEVGRILDELEESGVDIKTQVGIITPFQNQSALLLNEFRKRVAHSINSKKIGTVHAFQGSEFDIIILSLVAFNDKFHVQFISQSPNLLNVAVSRARNRLVVIGDRSYLNTQKGNIEKLLKHSQ